MSEEPSDWRTIITRETLRDGSLIAEARRRMPPGTLFRSDAEVQADLEAALALHPPGEDVWLFGYGSLMWNPALHFAERRGGIVRGWHRRYCLWLHAGRGSPENPGLMLALDRGGSCAGVLFRIAAAEVRSELLLAWRREMFTDAYNSHWLTAQTSDGPVRAVTFVANRRHLRYAGPLEESEIAARLASASGTLGTCREYLTETLAALHALGLSDHRLERLQRLIGKHPA
ncbi:MAG TPA: gamma-glutamylcyclotransferase [Acetobacteraceae bacterium]|nr:gamma-glutamylcyclotransferase [Acetobacteraceae bacterium]